MTPAPTITLVRRDDFDGLGVHTFARAGRPCWLFLEVERALREEILDFEGAGVPGGFDPFEGEDFERIEGDLARAFLGPLGHGAERLPVVLLYEGGLTLACAGSRVGHAIRRKLLKGAAQVVLQGERRASLEERVRVTAKQMEIESRARKAALLRCLIEHGRACGPLRGDDASYVAAMAIALEVGTGITLSTVRAVDAVAVAPAAEDVVHGARVGLCKELVA